jgi:hypothetical protein
MKRVALAVVLGTLGAASCTRSGAPAGSAVPESAPPPTIPAAGILSDRRGDTLTVGRLLDQPGGYAGQVVLVQGRCLGWNGPAWGQAPVSRSDWQLGDGGAAVWVSAPYPARCTGAEGGAHVVLRAIVVVDTIADRTRSGPTRLRPYLVRATQP